MQSLQSSICQSIPRDIRNTLLASTTLLLMACQTAPVERDYDTSRDFNQYRSWSWTEPAVTYTPVDDPRVSSDLTTQRIRQAVSEGLDVRGLRPAGESQAGDLHIQVSVISELEEDEVTTTVGGSIGYWGWGWGGGPAYTQSRSVDYQMLTLQIDLRDADDGQLVWRGSDQERLWETSRSPAERERQIREMVNRILSGYPPY